MAAGLSGAGSTCTDGRLLTPPRWAVIAAALAFLFLAVAAAVDGGSLLLYVDRPVEEFVVSHRYPVLDQLFRVLTYLGASALVVPAAVAVAALVWRRCRPLALSILAAVAVRPLFEIGIKLVVARPRPELDPLVDVASASFPSGHVLSAVAIWGLLPIVAGVLGWRRQAQRVAVAVVVLVVVLVAMSRVYLGVHWLTDVVGSVLIGGLFLLAVEILLARLLRPSRPAEATAICQGDVRHLPQAAVSQGENGTRENAPSRLPANRGKRSDGEAHRRR